MNACPDSATFIALVSACSYVGLVDEGVKLFNSMSDVHVIVPQLDHYSCMVDLYGRAGKLLEAENLIRKMPMKPDSVIWSSVLGSFRKHSETRLAKLAADNFEELEPNKSLGYVQMSNIYSSGLSWIEIGKKIHEFGSGGQLIHTFSLYGTEVEHKEDQLLHHSEKMALVFAMMNEGSLLCGGNLIKIMKNIGICVVCHNFMKLAAYLFQ
ncbi:hypothetical protein Fmac_003404 [Flemingia macrophylla]|uniref:DYW domain-containing protein n=1 Tax=Flemingia macrophylla TaxID=520843 RepID=A0ABD1NMR2_9FABA